MTDSPLYTSSVSFGNPYVFSSNAPTTVTELAESTLKDANRSTHSPRSPSAPDPNRGSNRSQPKVSVYMGWPVPFSTVCTSKGAKPPMMKMLPPVNRSLALQRKLRSTRKSVLDLQMGLARRVPEEYLRPAQYAGAADNSLNLVALVQHSQRKALEQQEELTKIRRTALASFLRSGGGEHELAAIIDDLDASSIARMKTESESDSEEKEKAARPDDSSASATNAFSWLPPLDRATTPPLCCTTLTPQRLTTPDRRWRTVSTPTTKQKINSRAE